ncbi:TraR/DksA C4-type zinc finger protein [Streptomyces sp. NPDC046939]|uniref:TraR/DksA family transcriptional regulator n=1 Tax=Streptomyces sp. NPDC046939 TaxID=3155376 RepID=UPI0033C51BB0
MSLDTSQPAARPAGLTPHEARQRLAHERASRLTQLQAIDEAGAGEGEGVMSAQKDVIKRVLTEIDAAFARIQDGTYGICRSCAKPVPVERLEILPYTPFCVPCQRKAV